MLTRASFQNYKALKAVDVDLRPFTVIVGKNGSGKTSVLQGIHKITQVPLRLADAFAGMGYALRAAMHYEIAGDLDPYDREYVNRMRKRNLDTARAARKARARARNSTENVTVRLFLTAVQKKSRSNTLR